MVSIKIISSVVVFAVIFLLNQQPCEAGIVQELLRTVIQGGLAGAPLVHQEQVFEFDPDVSQKRRSLYYETHGYLGEKYIERVGLGIDGNEAERREQQRFRDQGRLQGWQEINFP